MDVFKGYNHNLRIGNGEFYDAKEENTTALKNERVAGTTTEQSFDVFTVNKAEKKIFATKIGAGADRVINY